MPDTTILTVQINGTMDIKENIIYKQKTCHK